MLDKCDIAYAAVKRHRHRVPNWFPVFGSRCRETCEAIWRGEIVNPVKLNVWDTHECGIRALYGSDPLLPFLKLARDAQRNRLRRDRKAKRPQDDAGPF
jgi:hypothetical protein